MPPRARPLQCRLVTKPRPTRSAIPLPAGIDIVKTDPLSLLASQQDLRRRFSVRPAVRCAIRGEHADHRCPQSVDRVRSLAPTVPELGTVGEGHNEVPAEAAVIWLSERTRQGLGMYDRTSPRGRSRGSPDEGLISNEGAGLPSGIGTSSTRTMPPWRAACTGLCRGGPPPVHPAASSPTPKTIVTGFMIRV